ncbi:MAG: ABC transporter permease [Omnitrophica WOR_2 bacterium]
MFIKILFAGFAGLVIIHGLIHLIGFQVYARGAQVQEMPFKTSFLNGSLDLGASGTRIYGFLWLLPTLGFVLAGAGFLLHTNGWQPVLIASSLVSLVLTGIDWSNAFRGTLIDMILLGAVLLSPVAARFGLSF